MPSFSKAKLGFKVTKKTATAVVRSNTGKVVYRKKTYTSKKKRSVFVKKLAKKLAEEDPSIILELGEGYLDAASPTTTNRTYTDRRRASETAWADKREELQQLYMKTQTLPSNTCCYPSCSNLARFKCSDCGPYALYCPHHVSLFHQGKLHVPEEWKDGVYRLVYIKQEQPWSVCGHQCTTSQDTMVVIIDRKGRQHQVPVSFCECFSNAGTLLQLQLWPASCTRPKIAFTWDLMEWMNVMFVECHVSLKSMCQSLKWLSDPTLQEMISVPYNLLVMDSFAEFRFFCEQIQSLQSVGMKLSSECPVCPKEEGNLILSFDGMFGLKRWRKSGQSLNPPRHGERFFLDQNKVDEFVSAYGDQDAAVEKNCNSFVAGSKVHQKGSVSKLDETGVFGAVCRHEMPRHFFSLHHGERLANAVYLLRHVIKNKPEKVRLHVMYDIACKLKAHLTKSKQTELLAQTQLAVPTFHLYGHTASCQVNFSPKNVEGFALTDGEQVERLWSFMRNFSSITREMTPSNRIDALTDALLHYAKKTCANLDKLLVQRYKRAMKTEESAKQDLQDTMKSTVEGGPDVTLAELQKWATDGVTISPPSNVTGINLTNEEGYVIKLMSYYDLCSVLENRHRETTGSVHIQLLARQLDMLDEQLKLLEMGAVRWQKDEARYLDTVRKIEDQKRLSQLTKIHGLVSERWFLLQVKKRYADGHKIAQSLCKQVKRQTGLVKKEVDCFNTTKYISVSQTYPSQINLTQALNVQGAFWDNLHLDQEPPQSASTDTLPSRIKQLLVNKFLKVKNSTAEIQLIREEMKAMFTHYHKLQLLLQESAQSASLPAGYSQLIRRKLRGVDYVLHRMHQLFGNIISLPGIEQPPSVPVMSWDSMVVQAAYEQQSPMEEDDSESLDDLVAALEIDSSSEEDETD